MDLIGNINIMYISVGQALKEWDMEIMFVFQIKNNRQEVYCYFSCFLAYSDGLHPTYFFSSLHRGLDF